RLLRGGRERDRPLVERLDGRVELLLQLLHLVAEALHFLIERGFRPGVAGRTLEELSRLDEGDAELGPRGGRLRRRPRTSPERQRHPHDGHCTIHKRISGEYHGSSLTGRRRRGRSEDVAEFEVDLSARLVPTGALVSVEPLG